MRNKLTALIVAGIILSLHSYSSGQAPPTTAPAKPQKWNYTGGNFDIDKNVDTTIAILREMAKDGYTHVGITDWKFSAVDYLKKPSYVANVQKVRKACRDLNLAFCPFVCGANDALMSSDPNLCEGVPVVGAPFVAKGGKLLPVDDDCKIVNSSFEQTKTPNQPAGWSVDAPGEVCFIDNDVKYNGKPSIRIQDIGPNRDRATPETRDSGFDPAAATDNPSGNGRLSQQIKVKPFRYYHVTVVIKTENFDSPKTINITASGKQTLVSQFFDIASTQDWKKYDVVFNTLQSDQITFYAGSWGGKTGKMWIGEVTIEPGGLVNLIRRDACPFKIASEDGKTVYQEGKDFADAKDPQLGNTGWPGRFDVWHQNPAMTLPAGSRIKDGQKVLVSYCHVMNTYGWGLFACMNEPKVLELQTTAIALIHKSFDPDGYCMSYDEIRVAGWDHSCEKSGRTPAQTLAANASACVAFVKKEDPGKEIYVWSDMFDKYHNASKAGKPYYLVKGIDPWYGSWEGLPKDVIILNWHGFPAQRVEAMKFFADMGHRQILCGYYDSPGNLDAQWFKEAAQIPGIIGAMYTTWQDNFKEMGSYSKGIDSLKVTPLK